MPARQKDRWSRVRATEARGRRVGITVTDYERLAGRGPKRMAEALIARHNVRMSNLMELPASIGFQRSSRWGRSVCSIQPIDRSGSLWCACPCSKPVRGRGILHGALTVDRSYPLVACGQVSGRQRSPGSNWNGGRWF